MPAISTPSASDPCETHADWLEFCAMLKPGRPVSSSDFLSILEISGSMDAIDGDEFREIDVAESDIGEAIVEAAFAELDDRKHACGQDLQAYPFSIAERTIESVPGLEKHVYTFLSLLSNLGKDAGPPGTHGERLFEDLCAEAAGLYIGGSSKVFGFPRRVLPKGFANALDQLCREMGEGVGHQRDVTKLPDAKDDKLDVVAWQDFLDGRKGKLIGFGQCATGQHWEQKLSELRPDKWCSYWMQRSPLQSPVPMFFVPHRVQYSKWDYTCNFSGILFDRCRIAQFTLAISEAVAKNCADWTKFALIGIQE